MSILISLHNYVRLVAFPAPSKPNPNPIAQLVRLPFDSYTHKFTTISLSFNNFLIQTVCVRQGHCVLCMRLLHFATLLHLLPWAMHFIVEFIDVCHIISTPISTPIPFQCPLFIATLCAQLLSSLLVCYLPCCMRAQWGICITSLLRYFLTILVRPTLPLSWLNIGSCQPQQQRQQIEFE